MSLVSGNRRTTIVMATTMASASDNTPAAPILETSARMATARLPPWYELRGTPGRPERARMLLMLLPGSPPASS